MKMKIGNFVFLFILFILLGVLIVTGYGIVRKNPRRPIANIIETATKPSYTIENAPSETIKGNIIQMTGNVNWESRTATKSSPITNPAPIIQQGEEIDTQDNGQVSLDFPGAVSMTIAPKTQIDFVQTLPANFVFSIASGSAEFKTLSTIPVTVRAFHLLVKQNNGDVGVAIDEVNGLIDLNIMSGSVTAAYNDLNLNSHEVNFVSGQKASFNEALRRFE